MPEWNAYRASHAVRRKDGTFRRWKASRRTGTKRKSHKAAPYGGIRRHIEERFRTQTGRRSRPGDVHRTRNADGTYNGHAVWYIRTTRGWRKSPTMQRKPDAATIRRVQATARPTRSRRRYP